MAFSMLHQVSRVHNQGVIWYFNDSHVTEWIYMRLKLSKWVTKCACIHVRAWNTPVHRVIMWLSACILTRCSTYIYGTPPLALSVSLCSLASQPAAPTQVLQQYYIYTYSGLLRLSPRPSLRFFFLWAYSFLVHKILVHGPEYITMFS
jgi:hypothetical protein